MREDLVIKYLFEREKPEMESVEFFATIAEISDAPRVCKTQRFNPDPFSTVIKSNPEVQ
jgi:hypothetical protein